MRADNIIYIIGTLLDTAMSGLMFDVNALVGVGIYGMFSAFCWIVNSAISGGFMTNMGELFGRGEVEKSNESFSCGMFMSFVMNLVVVLAAIFFAEPIVYAFGAHDPVVAEYAAVYLRFSAIGNLFGSLGAALRSALLVYGYKTTCSVQSVIQATVNLLTSLLFVKVLGMGVEGLAFGTIAGNRTAITVMLISHLIRPATLHLYIKITPDMLKQIPKALSYGIPLTINQVAEFILGVVLNNVIAVSIVTGGLAIFTLYQSLRQFTMTSVWGVTDSVAALEFRCMERVMWTELSR